MWVLILVTLSGGASSSNMISQEFTSENNCRVALGAMKTNNEIKSAYCFRK